MVDITRRDQVDHMVQAAMEEYGQIDILVNNVGIAIPQPAELAFVTLPENSCYSATRAGTVMLTRS